MALIDKASLLMVPSTYEAGKLYNVLPSGNRAPDNKGGAGYDQTRADFDFDRGSNAAATRINSSGLIEKYQENKLLQSNQFDTTWVNYQSAETGGQPDKDGGNTAWKLTRLVDGANSVIYQTGLSYSLATYSVYAKAAEENWIYIEGVGSTYPAQFFDLQNGVKGTASGVGFVDSSITSVGGGWYRISITFNISGGNRVSIYQATANNTLSGSIGDGVYIMNAQLESGLCSTEYLNSTSTTGKSGVLIDLPRINYDANGENGALLLEPSRSNLIQFSEYWKGYFTIDTNVTISVNVATSPEGVQNAGRLKYDLASRSMYKSSMGLTGEHSVSFWVKGDGSNIGKTFNLRLQGTSIDQGIPITLTSDWVRVEAQTNGLNILELNNRNSTTIDTGSLLLYGFQIEPNATYATSYIPNHGTSGGVTRAADLMYTGPTDLGGGSVGTLMVEIERIAIDTANTGAGVQLLTSSDNEEIRLHFDAPSSQVRWRDANNGYAQIGAVLSVTAGEFFKMCLVSDGTTAKAFGNGAQLGGDYSIVTAFDFDKLSLPQKAYKVKQIYFSNQALTDAECVTLTTL